MKNMMDGPNSERNSCNLVIETADVQIVLMKEHFFLCQMGIFFSIGSLN